MSLIATARAQDDARFVWRVKAAALTVAAGKAVNATGSEAALIKFILDTPMADNPTLVGLIAANSAVSAAVTVDEHNTVSTELVPDSAILAAVTSSWPVLVSRWNAQV